MKNEKLLIDLGTVESIKSTSIPDLDLYMDQILTLINKNSNVITKTMINNYSKDKVITPVKGKKYNKKQILQIVMVNNLKNNLSINDIKAVINKIDIEDTHLIYDKVVELNVTDRQRELEIIDSLINISDEKEKLTSLLRLNNLSNLIKDAMIKIKDTDVKE